MRILHLRQKGAGVGGPESLIITLAELIDRARFDVRVASFGNRGEKLNRFMAALRERGVPTEIIPEEGLFLLQEAWRVSRLLQRDKIDLLHTHEYKSNAVGLIASRLAGVPQVASAHGWATNSAKARLYEVVERFCLRFCSQVIVGSNHMKQELLKCGVSENRIAIVPNHVPHPTVDVTTGGAIFRAIYGIASDTPLVGILGHPTSEKGHEYLIRAIPLVLEFHPQARFAVVGEGALEEFLKRLAADLGVKDKVIFTGFYDKKEEALAAFDMFVLASVREGLPLAMLEAASMDKPIVATAVGDVPEVIRDGITGYLVRPRDVEGLAKRIVAMLNEPRRAREMGQAAQRLVMEKYSAGKCISELESLYLSVLSERKRPEHIGTVTAGEHRSRNL